MNKWMTKKRIITLATLPVAGLSFTILLNFLAGPGYSTSINQGAVAVYLLGSVLWSVAAITAGVYMYSKCSSMNTKKFIPGIFSVFIGAGLPWIVGMQL
ncbi:hypothetical protein [Pseudoalteromonas sp.]|uniref:hypothetical protein n=1 Tax=Pseudoalteromonas sp. TaxID=53249 RepID=UPI001BCD4840|nr:hypothetical protein [Pseudoalteromonas sp.]